VWTDAGAAPDKPAGVIALVMSDLRRRKKIGKMALCDVSGRRFAATRARMDENIGRAYVDMDASVTTFPEDDVEYDGEAYKKAIATMTRGDVATIFTPDDTHFALTLACVEAGLHVLVAKPVVKTLREHLALVEAARKNNVLVVVEYHKRFDPMYSDFRDRAKSLGSFSLFNATMTQPKAQLDTFKSWAGRSSDISYYLNSHHMDIHSWAIGSRGRPIRVSASAARGAAEKRLQIEDGRHIEDTITLMVVWENDDGSRGTALYTASWIAPKADCHTQQYFHYMGQAGEVRVDQAHRGYTMATDEKGFATMNPLYMKYTPGPSGHFAGQNGYGYRSIECFLDAAEAVNRGELTIGDVSKQGVLATIDTTERVTAMLEAGRMSLDNGGRAVELVYPDAAFTSAPAGLRFQD